ncbi:MAG: dihydrofolate reductase family protein, partial [Bacteroidota bacterium]
DNPQLNVRDWSGKNPMQIVIDPEQTLDKQLNVFDQTQPTLCYTQHPPKGLPNLDFTALPRKVDWYSRISHVLHDLHHREVASVFVEGGAQLLSFLIQYGWWDEARVFSSETKFGEGIAAPVIDEKLLAEEKTVSDDKLSIYYR